MTERDHIDLSEPTEAELAALAALLSDEAVWEDPDPGVEDAVVAAITAEAAATPAPSFGPPPSPRARTRAGARRPAARRSGWGLLAGSAAAAALIIVVALVALQGTGGGPEQQLALRPPATLPPDASPLASADVTVEETADGTRIVLDVTGLAPAPAGYYYELWLRKNPQEGVSAGTFHLRGGGEERIELWTGVSPRDYPLITVTLQPEGMAESSGQVHLSGRLG
jgi:hypothetical protein